MEKESYTFHGKGKFFQRPRTKRFKLIFYENKHRTIFSQKKFSRKVFLASEQTLKSRNT